MSRTSGAVVYTQEQLESAIKMWLDGKDAQTIADSIKMSKTWVYKKMRDLGLARAPAKKEAKAPAVRRSRSLECPYSPSCFTYPMVDCKMSHNVHLYNRTPWDEAFHSRNDGAEGSAKDDAYTRDDLTPERRAAIVAACVRAEQAGQKPNFAKIARRYRTNDTSVNYWYQQYKRQKAAEAALDRLLLKKEGQADGR